MLKPVVIDWTRRASLGIAGGAALAFWAVELGWPIGGADLQRTAIGVMVAAAGVWAGCRLMRWMGR
jgi:hypothetical protein